MGIRLNSTVEGNKSEQKTESESLEQGLEISTSNPVPSPTEETPTVGDVSRDPASDWMDEAEEELKKPETPAPSASIDWMDEAEINIDRSKVSAEKEKWNLDNSRVQARTVDVDHNRQLRDVQEKYKVSADEAMALLTKYTYEELKVVSKNRDITRDYPATSKWAQKPENMKVMQKEPEAFKKLEESSKMLGHLGDLGNVAMQNVYTIPMMGLHAAVATGTVSIVLQKVEFEYY